ncbi:MAG TPA: hypothetical protein VJY34_03435 [Roseiarcus sp.]|nr:hypothetical protein [Roseiarcus sp.]
MNRSGIGSRSLVGKAAEKAGVTIERIVAEWPRSASATSAGPPSYQRVCVRIVLDKGWTRGTVWLTPEPR